MYRFDMVKFSECSLLENEHAKEYMINKENKSKDSKKNKVDFKLEAAKLIESYEPLYIEL